MKSTTAKLEKSRRIPPPEKLLDTAGGEDEVSEGNGNGKRGLKGHKLDIKIGAPNIQTVCFEIVGTSPLVVHRFSQKAIDEMLEKMINPPKPGTRVQRKPLDPEGLYNAARFVCHQGGEKWDGFNAAGLRCAMISACRLGRAKMQIAKISIFINADGLDHDQPQFNLIRIYGQRKRFDSIGRLDSGVPNPIYRPMYWPWSAKLRISFDTDQFTVEDIGNLLTRVGMQIGLCEGRPDSKNSAGQGWGLFRVKQEGEK
jgi:hypothetical protein